MSSKTLFETSSRMLGCALVALTTTAVPLERAEAQEFPARPVRFIVPYAPGGSGDILTRFLATRLGAIWGQQNVVENKPGGGGLIGTEAAARAAPDGYTIYLASDGPVTVAPSLMKSVPYDWKRDLAPLSMMAVGYQVLIIDPRLPATTLDQFVALARSKPGALNYASIGVGSTPHLGAEIFKAAAKVDITHVPYKGATAQALTALTAGEVAMFMVGTSPIIGPVKAGKLRALAVTSPRRMEQLPDVPTFAEAGMPGIDVKLWFALMAPGGTPPAIVRRLHADIAKAIGDAELKATLQQRGFEAVSSTPEELAAFLDKDFERARDLIRDLKLEKQ